MLSKATNYILIIAMVVVVLSGCDFRHLNVVSQDTSLPEPSTVEESLESTIPFDHTISVIVGWLGSPLEGTDVEFTTTKVSQSNPETVRIKNRRVKTDSKGFASTQITFTEPGTHFIEASIVFGDIVRFVLFKFNVKESPRDDPVVDDPVTDDPVTDDPVTDDPVTDDPVTDDPVTDDPVTDDPVTDDPVTDDPVTEDPVTEDPVTEDPVTEDPVTDDPVTDDPVVNDIDTNEDDDEEEVQETTVEIDLDNSDHIGPIHDIHNDENIDSEPERGGELSTENEVDNNNVALDVEIEDTVIEVINNDGDGTEVKLSISNTPDTVDTGQSVWVVIKAASPGTLVSVIHEDHVLVDKNGTEDPNNTARQRRVYYLGQSGIQGYISNGRQLTPRQLGTGVTYLDIQENVRWVNIDSVVNRMLGTSN